MLDYKYAWSLTKDEVQKATPPGTVYIVERHSDTGQDGELKLVPQPSEDPADPLNWAMWRKFGLLMLSSAWAFMCNYQAACISSALPFMVMAFPEQGPLPYPKLTHLVSANVFLTGISSIWWIPIANSFGRRPVVLFGLALTTGASIWAAKASSYASLLAARIIQGVGTGSAETVALDAIGATFFVHQQGRAVAFYSALLALGASASPIDGSYIANSYGWRWTLWITAIATGIVFVLSLFLFPETLYDRKVVTPQQTPGEKSDDSAAVELHGQYDKDKPEVLQIETIPESATSARYRPYTFLRSLKIGVYRGHFGQELIRPYVALLLPGVWVVTFAYSTLVASTISINLISSSLISAPPYNWGLNTGLINIGTFVGSIVGFAFTFGSADWVLRLFAKKEKYGLGEPESRLPILIINLWTSAFGNWVFGACAANPSKYGWVGLQFGSAMQGAGTAGASVAFNYVIESYVPLSGDCLTVIIGIRGAIAFAWTFFTSSWIESAGPMVPFGIYGMLIALSGIAVNALYIWGKRSRIATAKLVEKALER